MIEFDQIHFYIWSKTRQQTERKLSAESQDGRETDGKGGKGGENKGHIVGESCARGTKSEWGQGESQKSQKRKTERT